MQRSSETGSAATRESLDLELVRGVLQRKRADVDVFLERMRCIPRMLAAKNGSMGRPLFEEDLADLSQEIFSVVWRKLDAFEGRARLETWVGRFCLYLYMNALRRRKREATELDDLEPEDPQLARPEDSSQIETRRRILFDALARLQPVVARVIELREFERLSFERIAEELDVPLGTAKSHYYRGLDRMRNWLRPHVQEVADAR